MRQKAGFSLPQPVSFIPRLRSRVITKYNTAGLELHVRELLVRPAEDTGREIP